MAATVSIVVRAINATKAAFSEVGTQVTALNKSINAVGKAFRAMFVVGLIAQILKFFVSSTTQADKLKDATSRIAAPFKSIAQIIGNLIVKGLDLIAPILESIGKAAEWAFGLLESESEKAARLASIRQQEIADAEKKNAEEAIKLAKEVADKKAEYENKHLELINDALNSEQKLREQNWTEERKLLALRAAAAEAQGRIADPKTDELTKAVNRKILSDSLYSIQEIEKAQQERWNDEVQSALDALDEETRAWKQAEQEKSDAAIQRIEKTSKEEIEALEQAKNKALKNQEELQKAAADIGELITDKDKRRAAKEEMKENARDKRRRDNVLKEAEFKEKRGRQLTEREQLAIAQRELEKAGKQAGIAAANLQKEMDLKQARSFEDIAAIKDKLDKTLALKE